MRSLLTFSCPQLEREFLEYQANCVHLCWWVYTRSFADFNLCLAYVEAHTRGAAYRNVLPPQAVLLLFDILPACGIAAATFFTSFHGSHVHHQPPHALYFFAFLFAVHQIRQNTLWIGLLDAKPRVAFVQQVTSFTKENLYPCVMCFMVVLLPIGQFLGRLLVLGLLAVNLSGNAAMCASPVWSKDSAKMSPIPLGAANTISAGLWEMAQPFYHAETGP